MPDLSPGEFERDMTLGHALREALTLPHEGAFVTRMRAQLRQQRERSWDDVLAGWFWQGILAASVAAVLGTAALKLLDTRTSPTTREESVAGQLLDAERPGADVLMTAMAGIR